MRRTAIPLMIFALATARPVIAADTDNVDAIAREYTVLAFGVHEIDPEIVLVTRPNAEALAAAKVAKRDKSGTAAELGKLIARLDALPVSAERLTAMRARHLRAIAVSLRMQLTEEKVASVADDVERRFGFVPRFEPLPRFDPAIARLERALPGEGSIGERIGELRKTAVIPKDRIKPVFLAALTECRRRTAANIALPPEHVDVTFPPDPIFPGGNDYKGGGRSETQISSDYPHTIDQLLILACHEVYPGHHVHFLTLDTELAGKRGWQEFGTEIAGPAVPVAESVAETATGIAFTPTERIAFERDRLYPLAGIQMRHPEQWRAYWAAKDQVLGATSTVARDFLAGKIGKDQAKAMFMRYRLQDPRAAEQLLKVIGVVGSFVIASDLGWQAAERVMRGKPRAEQWRLLHRIESEPMLLADVEALR